MFMHVLRVHKHVLKLKKSNVHDVSSNRTLTMRLTASQAKLV